MARGDTSFSSVSSEGGLLPADLLARISAGDPDLPGLDPEDFGLPKTARINEETSRLWESAKSDWAAFQAVIQSAGTEGGVTETRNRWLLPLFEHLGYGRLVFRQAAEVVGGHRYTISHRAGEGTEALPIHTVSHTVALDTAVVTDDVERSRRMSPHSVTQEYLNRTDHLWGLVSNGRRLRLLRDNQRLSRAAYVEFDLEAMMEGSAYADFVHLYLLLHRSRLPQLDQRPEDCLLEQWVDETEARGARALDDLRVGVERAIKALGQGLIEHPDNAGLRASLESGSVSVQVYYRQLLRLVYRFLFLLAAEDRDLLFSTGDDSSAKNRYLDHYGVGRLRGLVAQRRRADQYDDLWRSLLVTFGALRNPAESERLGASTWRRALRWRRLFDDRRRRRGIAVDDH